jgi:hypothetical protein
VPPVFHSEILLTRRIRFRATADVSEASIRCIDISSAVVGIVATAATTCNILCKSIKLRAIELWFLATAAGTPVMGVIDWNSAPGTAFPAGPGSSVTGTNSSASDYTMIRASPPVMSSASFWRGADDTSSMATITLPSGGFIDVTVDFAYNDSDGGVSGAAIVGGSTGLWYHRNLNTLLTVMGNLNTIA